MMPTNEDEGFAEDGPAEYAQYSYSPCPAFRDTHRRPYLNPLKLKQPPRPAISVLPAYINADLQQLLLTRFAAAHPSPFYRPTGLPIDGNLSFDSAFESGNLQYVIALPRNVYELYIKPDTNTMTHFQWFYFKVRNRHPAIVTLVIKNFLKQRMSYREGLRPYHRSLAKHHSHYQQIPGSVSFGPAEDEDDGEMPLFELKFEFSFDCANDEVEFCSQPPYSYARYCKIYKSLPFVRLEISRTVLGNKIEAFLLNENIISNVIVVVMARQHPGESVGSWLMEGFVNRLVETQNNLSWVLLPMVNVDGVVLGNNRTGVQGYDFNRHWYIDDQTNRYHLFPELKGIIAYFQRKRKEHGKKVKIFLDFHGHSSEQNVFAYGPPHFKASQQYDISKVLPFLISKRNADFSLKQCSYHIESSKKNCSRAVFLQKFGFSYSYTIESSFGLYRGRRVNEQDMLRVGEDILASVIEFAALITEGKDRNNAPLKEILATLKEFHCEGVAKVGGYDSDSENQDQNAPIRRNFQQKLEMMLTKQAEELEGSLFDRLAKKREHNSYLEREYRQTKANASTPVPRNAHRPRMRTEEGRKLSEVEQGPLLPKVRWERERKTRSSKKNVPPCDLDRLSLQEMKERLMKMKHSELGRRILIIDSHQST